MRANDRLAWEEPQQENVTVLDIEREIARCNHRLANLEARVRVTNGPFFGPEAFNRIRNEVLAIEKQRTDLEVKLKLMKGEK